MAESRKGQRTLQAQEAFAKAVEARGCPVQEIAKIAFDPSLEVEVRLSALKEMASFGYAKVKAVEISGPDGGDITIKADLVHAILNAID